MTRWHLEEWAAGLPQVRIRLRRHLGGRTGVALDDTHSWRSFEYLLHDVLGRPLPERDPEGEAR